MGGHEADLSPGPGPGVGWGVEKLQVQSLWTQVSDLALSPPSEQDLGEISSVSRPQFPSSVK